MHVSRHLSSKTCQTGRPTRGHHTHVVLSGVYQKTRNKACQSIRAEQGTAFKVGPDAGVITRASAAVFADAGVSINAIADVNAGADAGAGGGADHGT
eukprot:4328092-Pleurochrysis_carterae.AAC.6